MGDYRSTLLRLAPRITNRDRQILVALWEHRVLTTHHLQHLFFPEAGSRRARSRLLSLHRYGVIDRFRRHAHDRNAPDHWILTPTGAVMVALHQGKEPDALKFRSDRALAVAHSPKLNHILGLAQTRVDFLRGARASGAELKEWLGERECEKRFGYDVRPDARLLWCENGLNLRAFVEYDTGTESLTQLKNKMSGYKSRARFRDVVTLVLFIVHSAERGENAAQKLAETCSDRLQVYLTTHHELEQPGAGAPIWRAARKLRPVRLRDIAGAFETYEEVGWGA